MFSLPADLQNQIVSYIPDRELLPSLRVSKSWHATIFRLKKENASCKINRIINLAKTTIKDYTCLFDCNFESCKTLQQITIKEQNLEEQVIKDIFKLPADAIAPFLTVAKGLSKEPLLMAYSYAHEERVETLFHIVTSHNLKEWDIKLGLFIKDPIQRDIYFFHLMERRSEEKDYNKLFNIMLHYNTRAFWEEAARRIVDLVSDANPKLLDVFRDYIVTKATGEEDINEFQKWIGIGRILCPSAQEP